MANSNNRLRESDTPDRVQKGTCDQKLLLIQTSFTPAVAEEIFDAFSQARIAPSRKLVESLAVLFDKSEFEILLWIAQYS